MAHIACIYQTTRDINTASSFFSNHCLNSVYIFSYNVLE